MQSPPAAGLGEQLRRSSVGQSGPSGVRIEVSGGEPSWAASIPAATDKRRMRCGCGSVSSLVSGSGPPRRASMPTCRSDLPISASMVCRAAVWRRRAPVGTPDGAGRPGRADDQGAAAGNAVRAANAGHGVFDVAGQLGGAGGTDEVRPTSVGTDLVVCHLPREQEAATLCSTGPQRAPGHSCVGAPCSDLRLARGTCTWAKHKPVAGAWQREMDNPGHAPGRHF
jgi:hypothetical protein